MNLGLWWVKPALGALALALAMGGFGMFIHHERVIGATNATAALKQGYDKGVAKAAADAQALLQAQQSAADKAHVQDIQRAERQAHDATAARTELERLRVRLASGSAPAASSPNQAGPSTDATAVAYGLLGECSGRYEEVAGDAGRLANQVIGLQDFIRADQIAGSSYESPPVGEGLRTGLSGSLVIQPTTARPGANRTSGVPPTPGEDT